MMPFADNRYGDDEYEDEMQDISMADVRERLFNKEVLDEMITDYQVPLALQAAGNYMIGNRDEKTWFSKSIDERAKDITKHILEHTEAALYNNIKELIQARNNEGAK